MEIKVTIEDRSLAVLEKLADSLGNLAHVPDLGASPSVYPSEGEKPHPAEPEAETQPAISIEEMRSRITDFCKADMKVNPGKIQSFFNSLGVESLPQVPKEKYGELLKIMGVA